MSFLLKLILIRSVLNSLIMHKSSIMSVKRKPWCNSRSLDFLLNIRVLREINHFCLLWIPFQYLFSYWSYSDKPHKLHSVTLREFSLGKLNHDILVWICKVELTDDLCDSTVYNIVYSGRDTASIFFGLFDFFLIIVI